MVRQCGRRGSDDGSEVEEEEEEDDDDDDDDDDDIVEGDAQFRGYGIGGAGNIRTYFRFPMRDTRADGITKRQKLTLGG